MPYKDTKDDRIRRLAIRRINEISISDRQAINFGNHKSVSSDDTVWELKWENGRRVYYSYVLESKILLLLGGNKNGQDYDIKQAKKILKEYI